MRLGRLASIRQFGLTMKHECRALLLFACVVACGEDPMPEATVETSTGAEEPEMASGTTRDEASTTESSSSGTETETETETGEEPPVECFPDECAESCLQAVEPAGQDESCECHHSPEPQWVLDCDLPGPGGCSSYECVVQSLRYGVPGSYVYQTSKEEGGSLQQLEVFGGGLASTSVSRWEYCCGYSNSSSTAKYYRIQQVLPPDDPFWDACLAEYHEDPQQPAPCLMPSDIFVGDGCDDERTECPGLQTLPGPEAGCEASCPMAGDGICDETMGTGLCADGCDPEDCQVRE